MGITENNPLISIVLPTYNGSKYVASAIESCLSQTYEHLELIIVNDCSNDETASIIAKYAERDKRVAILTNVRNMKLPASLNRGFSMAKGKYFTWISDDNMFGPDAIAVLLNELERDTSVDIVYSSYYFMNSRGDRMDKFGGIPEELLFVCVVGACFLYKREVHVTLGGFDASRFRMEDLDFWLRAAIHYRFRYIDQPELYYYRKHTQSLSHAIASQEQVYQEYRKDHIRSFGRFFKEGFGIELPAAQLDNHVQLYLEEIIKIEQREFDLADRVLGYLYHLEFLEGLDWARIGFDPAEVRKVLVQKRDRILALVINGLVFDNKALGNENPRLASQLQRPIFWYYKEYEVLPRWFKRIGHIIKAMQGNKPFKSLFKNTRTS